MADEQTINYRRLAFPNTPTSVYAAAAPFKRRITSAVG
jgi:hypothetical protein